MVKIIDQGPDPSVVKQHVCGTAERFSNMFRAISNHKPQLIMAGDPIRGIALFVHNVRIGKQSNIIKDAKI